MGESKKEILKEEDIWKDISELEGYTGYLNEE